MSLNINIVGIKLITMIFKLTLKIGALLIAAAILNGCIAAAAGAGAAGGYAFAKNYEVKKKTSA